MRGQELKLLRGEQTSVCHYDYGLWYDFGSKPVIQENKDVQRKSSKNGEGTE